jgi:environmental stress-induced protein Ves
MRVQSQLLKLIRSTDVTLTPWKNGGGSTRTLAQWPADSGLTDFSWRISIASIEQDGPFSSFDGVDRTLVLLDGQGMMLDFEGRPVRVDPSAPRVDFAGEDAPGCRLLDGPTSDFNLMWARKAGAARLTEQPFDGELRRDPTPGRILAAYLRAGRATSAVGAMHPGDLLLGTQLSVAGQGELWWIDLPLSIS